MSSLLEDDEVAQLKKFIELCKSQPTILEHPQLSFFKDYLISLGVTLPYETFDAKSFTSSGDGPSTNTTPPTKEPEVPETELSESESDVELDMEGVIKGDPSEAIQDMGDSDPSKTITDEDRDKSDEKRIEAMNAFSEQKYDEAIALYTDAIKLNPQSALLFAKRGQVFLKLNKLYACIKDCSHALELNCDSATAYKLRGRAYRLLGKFEEALHDLCESLKIDYDDQTNEWLNEVKSNAEKLRQHRLSVQRKNIEKEHRVKLQNARKAQEARAQAAAAPAETSAEDLAFFSDIMQMVRVLDLVKANGDRELCRIFDAMCQNPEVIGEYKDHPKVAYIMSLFRNLKSQNDNKMNSGSADATGTAPVNDDDTALD